MKIWRELLGYVKLIVIVVAITLVINNVVLINAKIPSPSMEKTLMVKDRLFGVFFFRDLVYEGDVGSLALIDGSVQGFYFCR